MDGVVELQAIRLEGSTSMSHCTRDVVRFMALYCTVRACVRARARARARVCVYCFIFSLQMAFKGRNMLL